MAFTVELKPSGTTFSVEPGETVLDGAIRENILVPYGCRNGAWGSGKGRLISGAIAQGEEPFRGLSTREVSGGWVLLCQIEPTSDITIAAETLDSTKDLHLRTLPVRVAAKEQLAHDVMALHLRLPPSERLQFLAGQYIDILLKDGRRRAFSTVDVLAATLVALAVGAGGHGRHLRGQRGLDVGALALLARVLQELLLDLRDERAEGAPLLRDARQHRPHLAQLLVAHLDLGGHVPARARRRAHLLARARDVLVRRPRERRREQARHDRVLADALQHLGDLGRLRVFFFALTLSAFLYKIDAFFKITHVNQISR